MDEKQLKQAVAVLNTIGDMLDDNKWKYEKHEDMLLIYCTAQGEDLPMEINIKVNPELEIVSVLSQMPFTVPESRRDAVAIAIAFINTGIVDGCFDYDYYSGKIIFRMTAGYSGSLMGKDMFGYMVFVSCETIDEFNDKLLAVAKSKMTNEEIIKFLS